jgi:hypothetical protein
MQSLPGERAKAHGAGASDHAGPVPVIPKTMGRRNSGFSVARHTGIPQIHGVAPRRVMTMS